MVIYGACILQHVGSECRSEGALIDDEGLIGVIYFVYTRKQRRSVSTV